MAAGIDVRLLPSLLSMENVERRLSLPSRAPFSFPLTLAYLRRRAGELVDTTEGAAYRRLLHVDGAAVLLQVTAEPAPACGLLVSALAGDQSRLLRALPPLRRAFGLNDDLSAFEAAISTDAAIASLVRTYAGLRLVRTQTAFEALIWAIIGQQINLTLAFRIKAALVRAFGESLEFGGRTYWAFPLPESLARVEPDSLAPISLSRRKSSTIVEIARSVSTGVLDLEAMGTMSREEAVTRLVALPGVGPWTAHYTLLRGLGDAGAFPGTDIGLRTAVGRLYGLEGLASPALMRELAERWGEWRGYAAFYLWNSLAERGA